jgi:hypothetical protein
VASKRLPSALVWMERAGISRVGEVEFEAMQRDLGIAGPALRKLLRETGAPLAPIVEGVRQESLEQLGRTLIALQHEYEDAMNGGDRNRARSCRALVITAKDHARLASGKKPEKLRMVEIMRVWLENPPVFESWWKVFATNGHEFKTRS